MRPLAPSAALALAFAVAPALLALAAASPAPVRAQWTLPRGDVVVGMGGDVAWAEREFFGFDDSPGNAPVEGARRFPLRGRYVGGGLRLGVRAGFTDELELELSLPVQVVSYDSDPVLLLAQPDDDPGPSLDFYQRNIIHLAQTVFGLADVGFAARYRLLLSPLAIAAEVRLKMPSGYRGPSGTFGDRPTSAQDFVENAGTYVAPGNVQDDVTLGDGQMDVAMRLLMGAAFPTRTFVRVELGYNLRLGDAGDQLLVALRAGQSIERVVLLYAGASLAYTVTPGRIIGVSVAAIDPELPAEDYGGTGNLLLREVRLQRDALDVGAGVIFRLTPEVELNVGYSQTVWGRNTAEVHSVSVGLAARAHLAPEPPLPVVELEPAPGSRTAELDPPDAGEGGALATQRPAAPSAE
jgi:hypothetical protein